MTIFEADKIVCCVRRVNPKTNKQTTVKPVYNGHPKSDYFQNFKTGGCLMQAKSNAESSYRSFLHYFQPALSNHLHLYQFIPVQRVAALDRFYSIVRAL